MCGIAIFLSIRLYFGKDISRKNKNNAEKKSKLITHKYVHIQAKMYIELYAHKMYTQLSENTNKTTHTKCVILKKCQIIQRLICRTLFPVIILFQTL